MDLENTVLKVGYFHINLGLFGYYINSMSHIIWFSSVLADTKYLVLKKEKYFQILIFYYLHLVVVKLMHSVAVTPINSLLAGW